MDKLNKKEVRFACGECGEIFDDESDADDCCKTYAVIDGEEVEENIEWRETEEIESEVRKGKRKRI